MKRGSKVQIRRSIFVLAILAAGCEQLGPKIGDGTRESKCNSKISVSLRRSLAQEMTAKPWMSPLPNHREPSIRPLQPIQITPDTSTPLGRQTIRIEVTEAGLSLSVMSSVIYGTSKRWEEIAAWNGVQPPFHIYLGQILILKEVSLTGKTDLNNRILPLWREQVSRRSERLQGSVLSHKSRESVPTSDEK